MFVALKSTCVPARPRPAPPRRREAPRHDSPVVCSGFGFDRLVYIELYLFVLRRNCSGQFSSMLWGARGGCLLAESLRRRSVLPGSASPAIPLCATPTRLARGIFGLEILQTVRNRSDSSNTMYRIINPKNVTGEYRNPT